MRIVIAGATSALGHATIAALRERGHEVVALGSNAARLAECPGVADGSVAASEVDLTDLAATQQLAAELGRVDGLVHLVGGWRGGGGLAGQSDEDFAWLESRVLTTLRNSTRAFHDAIAASAAGRIAIVSTTGVEKPTAGNANYVALKAASEAWLAAVGHSLRESAATTHVFRVKALVSQAERDAQPERAFAGYTDVAELAEQFAALFE